MKILIDTDVPPEVQSAVATFVRSLKSGKDGGQCVGSVTIVVYNDSTVAVMPLLSLDVCCQNDDGSPVDPMYALLDTAQHAIREQLEESQRAANEKHN